jgi:C-terminal processing protease CtpA/Prc
LSAVTDRSTGQGTFPKGTPCKPKFQTAVLVVAIIFFGTCRGGRDAGQKVAPAVQNLRTLAKLYGYLRYFHPSDEAARVDWDALAVHAVSKVKDAPDADALKTALEEVFRPVAPSMGLYFKGKEPPASSIPGSSAPLPSPGAPSKSVSWQHMGLGTGAVDSPYRSIRLNRSFELRGRATLARGVEAAQYAGKMVKLSAWIKVAARDMSSRAQLWLRVDRASGPGFFDNMSNRPIMASDWTEYTITGPIASDAQRIFFGALVFGRGEFLLDGFRLTVTDSAGREEEVALPNSGFEDGDISIARKSWNLESPGLEPGVKEDDVHEGKGALSLETRIFPFSQPLFEKRAPADGVIDKEIGRGLFARIPISLESDDQGTIPHADASDLDSLRGALIALFRALPTAADESVRLGDVVIAWNVFQHFYPYFDAVKVDWDAVLTQSLERALADRTEEEFLRTLHRLVARLDDGHGGVYHALQQRLGTPPFRVEWIEGKAVVTASRDGSFKRGDVIAALNGRKTDDIIREEEDFLSGSPQWKRFKACNQLALAPAGTKSSATVQRGGEVLEVAFENAAQMAVAVAPALPPVTTFEGGVIYVDLSRASWPDIQARMNELAAARGVVFDLRGYPNGNHEVLCHLLREPDKSSSWMKIPLVVLPDREGWGYQEMGWNLVPMTPQIAGRVVFLTDGRAISYSESVLGFVERYKLGEIVGEPTAGANGNVNPFMLPGGYSVSWTGMKVVKHDGSQHHTIGVLPTVSCRRTLAGVISGRDELLEKALEVINK